MSVNYPVALLAKTIWIDFLFIIVISFFIGLTSIALASDYEKVKIVALDLSEKCNITNNGYIAGLLQIFNYGYCKSNLDPKEIFPWGLPLKLSFNPNEEENQYINKVINFFQTSDTTADNQPKIMVLYGREGGKQKDLANWILYRFIDGQADYGFQEEQKKNSFFGARFLVEQKSKIGSDYSTLGTRLLPENFQRPDLKNKEWQSVKNWFEHHPDWLLVYEDVDSYEELEPYLPVARGNILVTTSSKSGLEDRNQKLKNIKIIDVSNLDKESKKIYVNKEFNLVDDYYCIRNPSRTDNLSKLEDKLKKYGIVAITGIAGAGKTQLAYHYAYEIFCKNSNRCLVVTISCDSRETLYLNYRDFARVCLGMPEHIVDIKDIKSYVKKELQLDQYKNMQYVLVFDSFDKLDKSYSLTLQELGTYFPTKLNPERQQIIITSQKETVLTDKEQNIYLEGFANEEEAVGFLLEKSEIPTLNRNNAARLAQEFSNLPLGLRCAKLYLTERKKTVSVDDYLNLLADPKIFLDIDKEIGDLMGESKDNYGNKKDGYRTQIKAIMLSIDMLSKSAKDLLRFCSFLNSQEIPLSILERLLFRDKSVLENGVGSIKVKLGAILGEYEKYSLILPYKTITTISIHQLVQKVCKLRMSKGGIKKAIMDLIGLLVEKDMIDIVVSTNIETMKRLRSLLPHALSVLSYAEKYNLILDDAQHQHPKLRLNVMKILISKPQLEMAEDLMKGGLSFSSTNGYKAEDIFLDLFYAYIQTDQLEKSSFPFNFIKTKYLENIKEYFMIEERLYLHDLNKDLYSVDYSKNIDDEIALNYKNNGLIYLFKEDFKNAAVDLEQAKKCFENSANSKGLAVTLCNLGYLSNKRGRWLEAIQYYQDALEKFKSLNRPDREIGWLHIKLIEYNGPVNLDTKI